MELFPRTEFHFVRAQDTTPLSFLHSWVYCWYGIGFFTILSIVAYVVSTVQKTRCLNARDTTNDALRRCPWMGGNSKGVDDMCNWTLKITCVIFALDYVLR